MILLVIYGSKSSSLSIFEYVNQEFVKKKVVCKVKSCQIIKSTDEL